MSDQPLYEAPASATVKVKDPNGFEFLLTTRAHKMSDVLDQAAFMRDWLMKHEWRPADGYTQPAPGRQAQQPTNGNGNGDYGMSFPAEDLTASMHEGKLYWKIKGGRFQKYGVTVWPEVLEAAGWVLEELEKNPLEKRNLSGWVAHYVLNDKGNPDKVVELTRID